MELYEYEKEHLKALRPHLAECTVLLKSNGDFPLARPCRIALYGSGARHTLKGGTGSGEVNSRFAVSVEEALCHTGFTITSGAWLDGYDREIARAKARFLKEVKAVARKKKVPAVLEGMGRVMPEPDYDLPMDAEGDAAVYVLARICGEGNDRKAEELRKELKANKTFLLNLMSSPGSGKTTTLRRTIEALKNELRIGIMEADIDSDVDAATIEKTGVKVIQLHTGGMCHLDAHMTRQGLENLGTEDVDLAILENIGNLVCPAEFDTGAVKNAMILSVPEGHDKPLKYPLMFTICDVLLINKIDVMEVFDFDLEKCKEYVWRLNPNMKVIPICAKTGEGVQEWADWLREQTLNWIR